MVVCQFFLQGRCRFGTSCRNEHPAPQAESGRNIFKERDGKFYDDMMTEVIAAERGQQWPLSCFAPFREHPTIPNLDDVSPEELRFYYYSAKNDGRIQDYIAHATGLLKKSEEMRNFLKRPSLELGRLLEEIISKKGVHTLGDSASNPTAQFGENKSSIFGGSSTVSQNPPSSNIFGASSASTAPSSGIFGATSVASSQAAQNANIFSRPAPPPPQTSSIFGGSQAQPSGFFTGQPSAPTGSIFGGSQPASENIFASAQPPASQGIFSANQPQTAAQNLFQPTATSQNIFQNQAPTSTGPSPFATAPATSNIFSSGSVSQNIHTSSGNFGEVAKSSVTYSENVYSNIEDLTEEEKEIYMAPMFSFGKIPLKPPPESLC